MNKMHEICYELIITSKLKFQEFSSLPKANVRRKTKSICIWYDKRENSKKKEPLGSVLQQSARLVHQDGGRNEVSHLLWVFYLIT